jgi:guanylate kinase
MNENMWSRKSMVLVVSGPSGAGKKTVLDRVREHDTTLATSVSATTREPRPGEKEGDDYYFLSTEEFLEKVEANEFLEHAEVHGELYGTLKKEIERFLSPETDVILELDVQGAAAVRELYADAVLVFIVPPQFDALTDRLANRGSEDAEDVATRLETARDEWQRMDEFDYIVVNDKLEDAVADVEAVIRAERCRSRRRVLNTDEGDTET